MSTSELPTSVSLLCGPVSAVDLSLFAAASGDHNPLHLDNEFASASGFERPLVHGMLSMAYVGRLLTQHFGSCSVVYLHTRFTGTAQRGEILRLSATFDRVENALGLYTISVNNERGQELITGTAKIQPSG